MNETYGYLRGTRETVALVHIHRANALSDPTTTMTPPGQTTVSVGFLSSSRQRARSLAVLPSQPFDPTGQGPASTGTSR